MKKSKIKKILIIAGIVVSAVALGVLIYLAKKEEAKVLEGREAVSVSVISNEDLINAFTKKEEEPEKTEPPAKEEPPEEEEKEEIMAEPLTEDPVVLCDLYATPGTKVLAECYEKDADSYSWEIYDNEKKDFVYAPPEAVDFKKDELGRSISTLLLTGTDSNQLIRCRMATPDGEKEESFHIYPLGEIESIENVEATLEGGRYIRSDEIPLSITYKDGSKDKVTGLTGLYFFEETEVNRERSKDEKGREKITKTVEITKSSYLYLDTEDKEISLCYGDLIIPCILHGADTSAPLIADPVITYDENTGVEIKAEDNITPLPDLTYAFLIKGKKVKDGDFSYKSTFNVEVTKNTTYTAYVKDRSGNIASKDIDLKAKDLNPPVISALKLETDTGYVTKNRIIVEAKDESALFYALTKDREEAAYGEDPYFDVDKNGTYTVYVKDEAGNESKKEIAVTNIDSNAPEILSIKENQGDKHE